MGMLAGTYEFAAVPATYPDGSVQRAASVAIPGFDAPRGLSGRCARAHGSRGHARRVALPAEARPSSGSDQGHLEMPDMQIDRVIRSVDANQGKLSKVLAREMPLLAEPDPFVIPDVIGDPGLHGFPVVAWNDGVVPAMTATAGLLDGFRDAEQNVNMIHSFACVDTEALFRSKVVPRFKNIERVARRKLLQIHAASE
eukprot:gene2021-2654_t